MLPGYQQARAESSVSQSASTSRSHHSTQSKRKPTSAKHHKHNGGEASPLALPGVQKIKASLRQTRRLLAKDKLAADVRTATERRLRALEADLAQAELARKERAMATRYHKIKFFERQKVTRRIDQTKRQLAADGMKKKPLRQLENQLLELRVDLNYIIHYPRLKKYISLFPPEVRSGEPVEADSSGTAAERDAIRTQMRERMATGMLSAEPEIDASSTRLSDRVRGADHAVPRVVAETTAAKAGLGEDTFFGDDDISADSDENADSE